LSGFAHESALSFLAFFAPLREEFRQIKANNLLGESPIEPDTPILLAKPPRAHPP
jgi:hypothetical protein